MSLFNFNSKIDFKLERLNCVKDLNSLINADKSKQWIKSDLKVAKQGWLDKAFWPLVKHSKFLSRSVYGIDPSKMQETLINFKERVKYINSHSNKEEGAELSDLYMKAVEKYNQLFPNNKAKIGLKDVYGHGGYQAGVLRAVARPDCNIQYLLAQAMKDGEPEIALWLVQKKGAVLPKEVPQEQAKLLAWLTKATAKYAPTPENLDHFALEVGYGYKPANLLVLQEGVGKIKLDAAVVKVPPFLPISDYEMRGFIFRSFPDLEEKWKQFLETTFDKKIKSDFLKCQGHDSVPSLQISEEGKKIINEIQAKISQLFIDECYFSIQIQEWLEKEKPDQIIVRSAGKEDTETNSNAGGNESVPFIKPDRQEISKTIGRVLASYFGEKSISQRLLAGDKTLFTETKPFLPVLLQKMVVEKEQVDQGKKNPDDIPRSGVLFTAQQDKARGVIFIQTGLGNNEGIVSSKVAVDTYHVKNGKVHAIVRNKKTRFVRNQQNQAVEVENNDIDNSKGSLSTSQSLSNPIVRDLAHVARWASKHYSNDKKSFKSLDMEYSIKLKEQGSNRPVIYLLQARPLVLPKLTEAKPNYVHMKTVKEKIPPQQHLSAKVLIDTRNEVQQIKKREEILFTDTLPQALTSYTTSAQKPRVIVIRKSAPATSHESVVLRSRGVTVIVVDEVEAYEKMKEFASKATSQNPLMVDTQRGCIVSTQGMDHPETLIKEGLISYPMPLEASIPQHFSLQGKQLSSEEAGKYLHQRHQIFSQTIEQDWIQLKKDLVLDEKGLYPTRSDQPNSKSLRELFEIMATDETEDRREAKRALVTLLSLMHAHLHQSLKEKNSLLTPYAQPLYHLFCYAVKLANREIIPEFNHPSQTLERLYGLKFLEAAIFQQPGEDVISGFSLATFLRLHQVQVEMLKDSQVKKAEDLIIVPCLKYGQEVAISQEVFKKWKEFVPKLKTEEKEDLLKQIEKMRSLNVFSSWLNVIFSSSWPSKASAEILEGLKQNLNQEKNVLQWVNDNRKKIPTPQQIAAWSDPQIAKKECAHLKSLFLNSFGYDLTKKELSEYYQQSGSLGKLAVVQFIRDTVTVYDTIIKQVTGNAQLAENLSLKATLFADLLSGYFEMMQSVIGIIDPIDWKKMMKVGFLSPSPTSGEYIAKLQKGNKYYFGVDRFQSIGFKSLCEEIQANTMDPHILEKQFEARPLFSVAGMVIGAHADLNFSVHWPTCLEEYFTTFHQNMEAICNHLNMKEGLNEKVLSDEPKELCAKMAVAFKTPLSFITRSEDKKVEVVYQIPLRQHAGSLIVSYDPHKPAKGVDIKIHLVGNHENDRWYQVAFIGAYLGNSIEGVSLTNGLAPNLDWKQANAKVNSVEFSLHLSETFVAQPYLLDELVDMLRITMVEITTVGAPNHEILAKLRSVGDINQIKDTFFSSTFWGLDDVLPLIKKDNTKLSKAITHIIMHLIDKEVNCAAFHINRGKILYDTLVEYLEELCFAVPEQFIELIKNLKALPLEKSNPELSDKIKEFANQYPTQLAIRDKQFDWMLAKGRLMSAISFAEKFNYKKELIQALGKYSMMELYHLYASVGTSSKERNLVKSYFTQISGVLKWGLSQNVLNESSQEIDFKIMDLFEMPSSFIVGSDNKIETIYQIPLREGKGLLMVSYDPRRPNDGLDIKVHMAGKNIHHQWHQAALIGAYLGNSIEGVSCSGGIEPKLDWQQSWWGVKEVEFSLHLSETFATNPQQLHKLINRLLFAMKGPSPALSSTLEVVKKLQGDVNINELKDSFFSSTFWGLDVILPVIKKDSGKLSKAIVNIVNHLIDKEVNCESLKVAVGQSLYDILIEHLEKFRLAFPKQFVELIKTLRKLPLEESNPELAAKIKLIASTL